MKTMTERSLRFDNQTLQDRLISELHRKKVLFRLRPDGTVECFEAQWADVNGTTHTIRDSCFRWYFSWFDHSGDADKFHRLLRQSGLPFELEHHEGRDIFLLSREYANQYDELFEHLLDEDDTNA